MSGWLAPEWPLLVRLNRDSCIVPQVVKLACEVLAALSSELQIELKRGARISGAVIDELEQLAR